MTEDIEKKVVNLANTLGDLCQENEMPLIIQVKIRDDKIGNVFVGHALECLGLCEVAKSSILAQSTKKKSNEL